MTWAHIRDTQRTARKPHRCFLCFREIAARSRYVERFGFDDGKALVMRMHAECEAVTRSWDLTDWECFSPGDGEWPEVNRG